jgi:hypothetical protein
MIDATAALPIGTGQFHTLHCTRLLLAIAEMAVAQVGGRSSR